MAHYLPLPGPTLTPFPSPPSFLAPFLSSHLLLPLILINRRAGVGRRQGAGASAGARGG